MSANSIVLIIDDEPAAREGLEALLAGEDYQLELAVNGPDGLAKAAQVAPDVILLDVMMPGMDGYEVCRRLRADPQLGEVPILMITALDDREARLEGIRAGADDFIAKPYDSVELTARLQSLTCLNRFRRLLEERVRLAWVLDHAADGYLILDEKDHLLYANSRACLYLGLPLDGFTTAGKFVDVVRRQYRLEPETAWAAWPRLSRRCYLVRPETLNTRAFWLQVEIFHPVGAPASGGVVQLRDVTEQVAARRDMRKFHSAVSHKLLTPLNHIYSGLGLLVDELDTLPRSEVERLANTALEGARRLFAELQDIFDYVSAPSLATPGEGFALAQLQAQITAIASSLSLTQVTVSTPDDLQPARLTMSQRAMELILWELLENAKKFHPRQSPAVEVAVVRAEDRAIRLQVRDDGLTLSPDQLAHAWEPYVQGEKHFTGEIPGMGLGLAMVAALVWQAKGAVRLANRPDGPGVVVELTLQLAP